jgi:tetratricopeptide (TPR) repeat protein
MRLACTLSVWFLLALAPSPLAAQSASEVAAARALFEEGVAAAGEARWTEALAAFERSYEIAPRSSTLLNLAGAQVELGRFVAATESYRRLIRDAGRNARERRLREQAEEALERLTPRLARLTLRIDGLGEDDAIVLDEAEVAHAIVGIATPVDPGAHRVAVRRGGAEIGSASLSLAEGESSELQVILRPVGALAAAADEGAARSDEEVPEGALAADATSREAGGDDVTLPVVLTTIGVLVVGGVVAAVLATQLPGSPSYYTGNLGDGQIRF